MILDDISVFFVFKQKTAYEMRISDWSSDVCSSDLRLIGDRKIGPDADKGGSRRIRPEWLSALGGHEQHRGDLLQLDHHLVRIGAVDVAERIITGGRSEEHTSELQSLMRISYAVFCLKKKNVTKSKPDCK